MADPPKQPDTAPPADKRTEDLRVINAADIFQGAREVFVEIDGVRYRLRITRRNKLILQK